MFFVTRHAVDDTDRDAGVRLLATCERCLAEILSEPLRTIAISTDANRQPGPTEIAVDAGAAANTIGTFRASYRLKRSALEAIEKQFAWMLAIDEHLVSHEAGET